jgi:ribose transport system ATP-binding protein
MSDSTVTAQQPALQIRHLAKSFGAQLALRDVDLTVERGEIHALLGENGAGKSTLIKILAGVYTRDAGDIIINGEPAPQTFATSRAAGSGLAFVHQDLGLVDSLSVTDNVALETGYERRRGLISFARTEAKVANLLARVGVTVDPRALVADLPQDQKVMVAVARALSQNANIVVLDEVSASLPAPDMARLAQALRASRATGVAYVLVTHRVEEVFELADRVTVLRDGKVRASTVVADTTHEQIVEWIVGRAIEPQPAYVTGARNHAGRTSLTIRGLTGPGLAAPVTIDVAPGEVLGVCGLIGSGTRALAALLGGGVKPHAGTAALDGEELPLGDSRRMRRAGCVFVPGDRQGAGAVSVLSIRENLFLARGRCQTSKDRAIIVPSTERAHASRLASEFGVRPTGTVERPLDTLSGGNQQKVILGRALRAQPRLLVLEDPTAGVDVGSRIELHRLVQSAAAAGAAVVLVSTDFDEVASQSHRVLVMSSGCITTEIGGSDVTAERLAVESYARTDPVRQ